MYVLFTFIYFLISFCEWLKTSNKQYRINLVPGVSVAIRVITFRFLEWISSPLGDQHNISMYTILSTRVSTCAKFNITVRRYFGNKLYDYVVQHTALPLIKYGDVQLDQVEQTILFLKIKYCSIDWPAMSLNSVNLSRTDFKA